MPAPDEDGVWATFRRPLLLRSAQATVCWPSFDVLEVVRRSSKQRGDSAPTITLQAAVWQRRLSAEYESLLVTFGQSEADRAFGLRR
jgi:hypothetical protein